MIRRIFCFLVLVSILFLAVDFSSEIKENRLYLPLNLAISAPLDESPDLVEKYMTEAKKYYKEKDYINALQYVNKIIEINPNDMGVYIGLSNIHYYLGNYEEAISALQRVIEHPILSEDKDILRLKSDTYIMLGIIYDSMGQGEKAKEALSEAINYGKRAEDFIRILFIETLLKKI